MQNKKNEVCKGHRDNTGLSEISYTVSYGTL